MPGESYFMAMGAVGLSLAGFAGLIAAFDQRPGARSPVTAWRIRNVVSYGFMTTFAGFGTVAVFTISGANLELTVRLMSLLLGLAQLVHIPLEMRSGPAWPVDRDRRLNILLLATVAAVMLGNVLVASLGYLQLNFLLFLGDPASIFFVTIRDLAQGRTVAGFDDAPDVSDAAPEPGATIGP